MPAHRSLAFVAHQETLSRLPGEATVLPLRPTLSIPENRLFESSPEALLNPEDDRQIEREVESIVANWWKGASPEDIFTWRGVNLAECFAYHLMRAVRDMVKSAWIVDAALADSRADAVLTDVPSVRRSLPSFPYLTALGSLLEARARTTKGTFRSLAAPPPPRRSRRSPSTRMYLRLAGRAGMSRLRSAKPLVAFGPYPEFYLPLARAWRRTEGSTVVATTLRDPIRAVPRAGLYVLPVEMLLTGHDQELAGTFLRRALETLEGLSFQGPLEQRSLDLGPVLRTHLVDWFRTELLALATLGVAFERGLHRAQHLVLLETRSPMAHAAVGYARLNDVSVTVLQHGILGMARGYRQTHADKVAAWGPADAEWFRMNLDGPVRVEATGSPRYDGLTKDASTAPNRGLLRIPSRSQVVLFASQPFVQHSALTSPWTRSEVLQMVLEAARQSDDFVLIVKWHPSERPESLRNGQGGAGDNIVQVHGENTWALIRRCQMVLTHSSTVALEGMFLDRPIVFLGHADPESPFHPPEDGAGLRVQSVEELARVIGRLLEDASFQEEVLESQRAYLERTYRPLDGQAADRVVHLLQGG